MQVTVTKGSQGEGRFERRCASRQQYGHVIICLEPEGGGGPASFSWEATEDEIPSRYRPAVERGVKSALAGDESTCATVLKGTRIRVIGGSHDRLISNDLSFMSATAIAMHQALQNAEVIREA